MYRDGDAAADTVNDVTFSQEEKAMRTLNLVLHGLAMFTLLSVAICMKTATIPILFLRKCAFALGFCVFGIERFG